MRNTLLNFFFWKRKFKFKKSYNILDGYENISFFFIVCYCVSVNISFYHKKIKIFKHLFVYFFW